MKPIEQLKIMSKTVYRNIEGEEFRINLKKGLTRAEINKFKKQIPNEKLDKNLKELLEYSRGFEIPMGSLTKVYFNNFIEFGFEELMNYNLTLMDDMSGNYWIQGIGIKGDWEKIYYVCHDPPVIVKQSENLTEFLIQLNEYLIRGEESYFSKIINQISFELYHGKGNLLEYKEAVNSTDKVLSKFASNYNQDWFIADLRNAKNGEGFRLEASSENTIRFEDELIWAMKKYKSFWTKLREKFK